MTPEQVVDLLTLIAARDRRTLGKADVTVWAFDIGDLDYDDACQAVADHFREDPDTWLMAGHVRKRVKAIREARIGPAGPGLSPIPPPADPDDPQAYMAALRAQQARIASGAEQVPAIEAGDDIGGYESNQHVQKILADYRKAQDAAARRKAQEADWERQQVRAYIGAVEQLLAQPDRGKKALEAARHELYSDEQAAQGYPLLAATAGVMDEHKVTIRAAWLIADGAVA
ncbi:hypothetical protein AB0K34_05010 [Actinomadura sp. NPDC049382]|uniref:hypothetical protein n=1 Tax=Actinomadura sp. NPDC049382 TaxID=3158220 RepID=UPI00342991BA